VVRFQAIAPINPAKTTVVVIAPESAISWATVAATSSEMKAPAKLSSAASITAARGDSARVETEAAMTSAVSWKPLVKTKASAVPTTITRMMSWDTG
jgi:hypothetical protein